ncbi:MULTISPECIES: DUF11 domain-containing protein [unclassified Leifsonia]|uniref:DUF7507 domain-containing protein n=1 Tax=unclassified Leifsonia TaxID=2663824 RepID=UPI0008A7F029|nr:MULTISPECIES: DUF11 domain-containing protein [unclassified Leifsonia]SEH69787.1 conserved repeat domain-containing protein [Leifsonia sp. CL154]SFL31144.1 conserved repeat domain-containing protein [Leifsonia sp. CL147]
MFTSRDGRLRTSAFGLAAILLVASAVALGAQPAAADVTPVSTVYKTGTDPATGSSAASPGSPGGQRSGQTHPGDTIDWVMNYSNSTGADAAVDARDALTGAGTYVNGSLVVPPAQIPEEPFQAQYSSNGGGTWQQGAPPAGATGVGFTGGAAPAVNGLQKQFSQQFQVPSGITINQTGGDAYNGVVAQVNGQYQIYTAYHHNTGTGYLLCTTATGNVCPGWPGTNSYASTQVGAPLGTGPFTSMATTWQNGTFLSGTTLTWEAQARTVDATGLYPVGMMCLDIVTLVSCGFHVIAHVTFPPYFAGTNPLISGTGLAASDGNDYFVTADGDILCFNPTSFVPSDTSSTGLCGTFHIPGVAGTDRPPLTLTVGNYVFAGLIASPTAAGPTMYCYNVVTGTLCPGYPVAVPTGVPAGAALHGALAPILDGAGAVTGVCSLQSGVAGNCWNLAGGSVPSPYPTSAGFHDSFSGDTLVVGTKVYPPVNSDNSVGCFDFATMVGGQVQPCAGFTPPSNPTNYTSRQVAGIPGCLLAAGDGRVMNTFDATTGGPCASTFSSATVNPIASYCGSGAAGFHSWNSVEIDGLPSTSYGSAVVTVFNSNGQVVAGFDHVQLPNGVTTLDISSIPKTGATASLTAQVELLGVTDANAVTLGRAAVTWNGDPVQACFQTIAPPVSCGVSGVVSNDVTITTNGTGGSDTGNSSGPTSFTNTNPAGACVVDFAKSASPPTASPGQTVTWTISVTNNGTVAFDAANPATFTDDLSNVLNNATYNDDATASAGTVSYAAPVLTWSGPLAVGGSATITYTGTANATNTGSDLVNTVVSESEGSNCTAAQPAAVCTQDVPVLGVTLVKSVDPATVARAGDTVTYSYLVTNIGSQPLSGMTIVESAADFTGTGGLPVATCPLPTLNPNQSETCTATYTMTQADVDAGFVDNTATAEGTAPGQPAPTVSNDSSAHVTAPAAPSLTLDKTVAPATVAAAGDTVTYSYLVTNNGTVTLNAITILESAGAFTGTGPLPVPSCPQPSLAPNTSETCTAAYTVTQADVDAGFVDNTATAQGTAPGATTPTESNESSAAVTAPANPALTLVKSVSPATVTSADDLVTYSYLVTNTGNVTLHDIDIREDAAGFSGTGPLPVAVCPLPVLAPSDSETCTANYRVTQADVDAGEVLNTATALGTPPGDTVPVESAPDDAVVTATASPALSLVKSATPGTVHRSGDAVTYSYLVTNTGNVTLTAIGITESAAGFTGTGTLPVATCPQSELAPGQSETCTADYQVTQADIDAGRILNSASAHGTPPGGAAAIESAPDDAVVISEPIAGIAVVKSVSPTALPAAGSTITYRYIVTNTGSAHLTAVAVLESAADFSGTGPLPAPVCPKTALAPGESMTCTADYVVTSADEAARVVSNVARAQGLPRGATDPIVSAPSEAVIEAAPVVLPGQPAVLPGLASTGSMLGIGGLLVAMGLIVAGGVLGLTRLRARRH